MPTDATLSEAEARNRDEDQLAELAKLTAEVERLRATNERLEAMSRAATASREEWDRERRRLRAVVEAARRTVSGLDECLLDDEIDDAAVATRVAPYFADVLREALAAMQSATDGGGREG